MYWPTPGKFSTSDRFRGNSPPRATISFARARRDVARLRQRPIGLSSSPISSTAAPASLPVREPSGELVEEGRDCLRPRPLEQQFREDELVETGPLLSPGEATPARLEPTEEAHAGRHPPSAGELGRAVACRPRAVSVRAVSSSPRGAIYLFRLLVNTYSFPRA